VPEPAARWCHDGLGGPGRARVLHRRAAHRRSRYLYDHLRAIAGSGLPIERYYHWCFVDNWEWAEGEVPRFGMVRLDHATQERTVKESGHFLAAVIADRGVTEASYAARVASQRHRIESEPSPRG